MKMRCMIVDDEPLVRELLEDYISQLPYLELVQSCKNAMEALTSLQQTPVDLILLDIQMPRLNGLQMLQSLHHPPLVIIVSAYEQYALEGFNLQVVDYILKPLSLDRFMKACNRAADLYQMKNASLPENNPYFFVNVEYTHVRIDFNDIEYVEGLKDYVKIYLSSTPKPVITRATLKWMEAKLPPGAFIRAHKSFLVAISKITAVKRDFLCVGTMEIPVSDTFRGNIIKVLSLGRL